MPDPGRTALYRLYDSEGHLLYVGITNRPAVRIKEHAHEQPWWHHVARTDIEWIDSRRQAQEAEDAVIRTDRPLYNGTMHLGPGWRRLRYQYDYSADVETMTVLLRNALQDGAYAPRRHLWPLWVGEDFGFSRVVANSAMHALAKEGLLKASNAGYWVC